MDTRRDQPQHATIPILDQFGSRNLIIPEHEVVSDMHVEGLATYVRYIEFATGTRLRDGENPVWFVRAFRGLCAEMGNDEAMESFANYCDEIHFDRVETAQHSRITGNTLDEFRSETFDDPFVHLISLCDAAWSCWTLARRFKSNYGMASCPAECKTDEIGRLAGTMFANRQLEFATISHVRLDAAIERWHQLLPVDLLDVIKEARSDQLQPIQVGEDSFATAHEASIAFAEKVSDAWKGARGIDSISFLTDLAQRLEPLKCDDLQALIEIESIAARRRFSGTDEGVVSAQDRGESVHEDRAASYLGSGRIQIGMSVHVLTARRHITFIECLLNSASGIALTAELARVVTNPAEVAKQLIEWNDCILSPFIKTPRGKKNAGYRAMIRDCRTGRKN